MSTSPSQVLDFMAGVKAALGDRVVRASIAPVAAASTKDSKADLMQNLYFLSRVRETPRQNVFFNHHYDHPPSFLALICVLKI